MYRRVEKGEPFHAYSSDANDPCGITNSPFAVRGSTLQRVKAIWDRLCAPASDTLCDDMIS